MATEASLQETIFCGENRFTVEDIFWALPASNMWFEKRLVTRASILDSNVDDRSVIDQERFSR